MTIFVPSILFFTVFLIFYITDKRRIINGFFLMISLLSFAICLFLSNSIFSLIFLILIAIFVLLIPILVLAMGVALIYNSKVLLKHEGKRLHNFLSMLVGIGVIAIVFMIVLFPFLVSAGVINYSIFAAVMLSSFYLVFIFINFFISSIIYNLNRPAYNKDFIIILGSGLIGDRVPPLLASRIDRGILFYNEQKIRDKIIPKFIVSGGKGKDELISEAEAIKRYLVQKGIPESDIILEDKSTNTYENMKFSKQKMDSIKKKYKSIFVTNNFHLLRAGIYAKKAGLKANGIGSKTAMYYLPNAFIREYIAILVMHKKVNSAILLAIFIISFAFVFIK